MKNSAFVYVVITRWYPGEAYENGDVRVEGVYETMEDAENRRTALEKWIASGHDGFNNIDRYIERRELGHPKQLTREEKDAK